MGGSWKQWQDLALPTPSVLGSAVVTPPTVFFPEVSRDSAGFSMESAEEKRMCPSSASPRCPSGCVTVRSTFHW